MTLSPNTIRDMVDRMLRSGVTSLHASGSDWSVSIELADGGQPVQLEGPPAQVVQVKANCVGMLLLRHPMRTEPFFSEGDLVAVGDTLAVIACGPLYREVMATHHGRLRVLLENQSPVDFGRHLFEIDLPTSTTEASYED